VPTQHGTTSHNRWKGNRKRQADRQTERERERQREERISKRKREREREEKREREVPTRPRVCQLEHYYTPSATQEEENIETTAFLLCFLVSPSLSLLFTPPTSFSRALAPIYLARLLLELSSLSPRPPPRLFSTSLLSPLFLFLLFFPFAASSLHFRFNVG